MFVKIPAAEYQVDNVTQTVVTVTTVSAVILPANPERKYLRLKSQGTGTQAIYVKFSSVAATTSNALEILDTQEHEEGIGSDRPIYTGDITAITSAGTKSLYVEERS